MADRPFPTDPRLSALTIAYRNMRYIADDVLPRVTAPKKEYRFKEFSVAQSYAAPDDTVGRASAPNQVDFKTTETSGLAVDHALDAPIPIDDINEAPEGSDPEADAVTWISEYIAANRERRVAAIAFGAANYPTGFKQTLVGTAQFSDFANSLPIEVISDAIQVPLIRPNVMVIGQPAWIKFRRHPEIVSAVLGNDGTKGIATRQQVADLFELEEVLVGESRVNTAAKGQPESLSRIWGKHIALHHRNRQANLQGGITWGFSPVVGTRVSGSMPEKNIGMRGGVMVRTGETIDEKVIAQFAGYFVENAVA